MHIHFISDLHLSADRPTLTALFERYLAGPARAASCLYILGDLFEYWAGDDDLDDPLAARVASQLAALADAGTQVFFMPGNRDFLIGADFSSRARLTLLPDPTPISLDGQPALLCHGDSLCTDDLAYQAFRAQVRHPAWRAQFLAQPLPARLAFAAQARAASQQRQQGLQQDDRAGFETITDVAPATVAEVMQRYGVDLLIHGHTHRPAVHALALGARTGTRVVLGDWYTQGSVLRADADGLCLEAIPAT